MPKIRRGGYVFLTWKGDHSPRHVHVYRDGRLILKGGYPCHVPNRWRRQLQSSERTFRQGRPGGVSARLPCCGRGPVGAVGRTRFGLGFATNYTRGRDMDTPLRKWDLDNGKPMAGNALVKVLSMIRQLDSEGLL